MLIKLKPCPFCGKGEVTFVDGAIRHTVPHQKKCALFHVKTSGAAAEMIEDFINENKDKRLEEPVEITRKSWIGKEAPQLDKKFGQTVKLLDHKFS